MQPLVQGPRKRCFASAFVAISIKNRSLSMRKLVCCLAVLVAGFSTAARAQMTIDMSKVTCANYLAMTPDQSGTFSAWMSGWFNHRWGYVSVGFNDFARNVASVKQWCTTNPQQSVMAGLERSFPQPAPVTGQIKVDMSLITCRQLLTSDAERQNMIAAWMSGYFRASTGQTVFDFQRFANNKRAVSNFCKKRGGETVMSAIQKSAR
jgi:hypothetical protein